ncbi:DUF808 domain-containing protein [Planktotalea arctica]|uniref:DUF808 domain-containing protein n=1 Tax=Planktotalea arctica TaxID=1481893 RepID=UPI000A17573C|nr:DUF808 domain-containing protein [Planktotalea arctica]
MSGLLALLDDVAGIAKIAAASIDDVAAQALKAGSKAAGAVIDDTAVTPKYVQGFDASRELPIIWRIARGSIINKLVILLPVGLALSAFAPFLIPPLLMLGGAYLCFEGAEKIAHWLLGHHDEHTQAYESGDPAQLEEDKIKGAIKTDFILSAEIMTIALAAIPESGFWMEASTLALVAVGITVAVYGSVALIVKADDVGLAMARGRLIATRALGRGIVQAMPKVMKTLTIVGTAAMLWVGGSIIIHSVKDIGWSAPYALIHDFAVAVAARVPEGLYGFVGWFATALADGVFGVAVGLALIPVVSKVIAPAWKAVVGK